MNIFQESCSILAVLLLFLLQVSRADAEVQVHKAVGDSLDLIAIYSKENLEVTWRYNGNEFVEYDKDQIKRVNPSLFLNRLKMYKNNISITIEDLKLQDSGIFSIFATRRSDQLPSKVIVLQVHEPIRDVQIEFNNSWLESKNICEIHLRCLASGDLNPSYSWSGDPVKTGQNQTIELRPAESATVSCTASNTVSTKHTVKTVMCTGKSEYSRFCVKMLNT
ncbi:CD48 antigen-like [Siphateles boraxobius]|uniref:CD48 antigen-like n=1 Tax=Siphateles boraxobius TaxID=180520 RepID=UPI0040648B10